MRSKKDRRSNNDTLLSPIEENGRATLRGNRRRQRDRRIENLDADERQLMLSEMPSPTRRKPS